MATLVTTDNNNTKVEVDHHTVAPTKNKQMKNTHGNDHEMDNDKKTKTRQTEKLTAHR